MYKNIKEKFKRLFKYETKIEHYEMFLLKVETKKRELINKDDLDSKERIKIINNLINNLEKKIAQLKRQNCDHSFL